jgi:hypothetical protein
MKSGEEPSENEETPRDFVDRKMREEKKEGGEG